jgi:hypothetical protein
MHQFSVVADTDGDVMRTMVMEVYAEMAYFFQQWPTLLRNGEDFCAWQVNHVLADTPGANVSTGCATGWLNMFSVKTLLD